MKITFYDNAERTTYYFIQIIAEQLKKITTAAAPRCIDNYPTLTF
jgi:hypothetical protein